MIQLNDNIKSELTDLCKKHKVVSLYLFGSAARNDFSENLSDMDFLVEFSADIEVLDFARNFFDLQFALEELFKKPIDLVCTNELKNPILIQEIENSKLALYAA